MTVAHPTTPRRANPSAIGPGPDSEVTWLLHRAALRLRTATGQQAQSHGIQLRDHIVLSALHKSPDLTQNELGRALALDKTTLVTQLDRLERAGLIERRIDPRDRRARIPAITTSGERIRAAVAADAERAEREALHGFDEQQVQALRAMLFAIIGDSDDPGSCL
ncbi:MarR family winged helix-turn-helix transcriptional regulator [Amnibacterium kyonggiense]|uniref:DNA-binding MarR family transcriptional regulator n=1 Tax=Amnibacterium kyonggiense TaxID=595671 RepID=A0A4R7FMF2_9MICO|nr:MarR family winged helix-turn-helix transcriptional regulator [Amnibacterium kyonggiense]TDS77650.1 DNA-binding MarR family transcriptional regulator [Amnibacterium kyonggiense]